MGAHRDLHLLTLSFPTRRSSDLNQFTNSGRDIVRQRLQKAVDAPDDLYPLRCEDTPGCIPIDLFGPAGSITQAQLDSVSADHYRDIKADLRAFVLNLSGPLIEQIGRAHV